MRPARRTNPGRASRTPFPFTKALAEHDITLDEPLPLSAPAVRRMEKQSLRSAGGVEIKVPVNVYRDESALEFIRNPDGSMSLLIKNIIV